MKKCHWYSVLGTFVFHGTFLLFFLQHMERMPLHSASDNVINIQMYQERHDSANQAPNTGGELKTDEHAGKGAPENGVSRINSNYPPSEAQDKFVLPPKEPPFIPASEADVGPQPNSPIMVPFPDASLGKPKGNLVLIIYVNSIGVVERVEIDQSELPAAFEQAAINAFLHAQMQPAMKSGMPIRSKMKLMVEFEER